MTNHPVSVAGIAALDDSGTIDDADKRMLIDFRVGDYPTTVDDRVDVDFTTAPGSTINRLVIPAGHNLDGLVQRVWAEGSFPPSVKVSPVSEYTAGAGVIDVDLSIATGNERYWRFIPVTATTIEIAEFWLGEYIQLSSSAAVDTKFDNGYEAQVTEVEYPGGLATVELATPRRSFSLEVMNIDPSGADYAALEDVILLGRGRPFWYWPPDDTDAGPFLVQLARDAQRTQDFRAPTTAVRYTVKLDMIEQAL